MRQAAAGCRFTCMAITTLMTAIPTTVVLADEADLDRAFEAEIERLEKASELDEDQVKVLRELRANPVNRNESQQISREFQDVFAVEELTDEALS